MRDRSLYTRASIIVSIAGSVVLVSSSVTAEDYLTGDEIRATISGNTIESLKGTWRVYFNPTGENVAQEGTITDRGEWRIEGDSYCARYENWVDGREMCWMLKRRGDRLERKGLKGASSGEVKLLEGNPANL